MHKAHELRTPLTAMIAGLCLLVDHSDDLSPEQRRKIMTRCLRQAKRLAVVIDGVLHSESGDLASLIGTLHLEEDDE